MPNLEERLESLNDLATRVKRAQKAVRARMQHRAEAIQDRAITDAIADVRQAPILRANAAERD